MKFSILETFVGAGGSHLGFKQNGFKSVFVNDVSDLCIKTLLYNNPEIKESAIVSVEDITKLNGEEILRQIHFEKGQLDVMFGGIVCKGFSLAGERSPNDPRNNYYHFQLNLVKSIMPKISIIENVPGIMNAKILASNVPTDVRERVDKLWQELENYKGFKANARKTNNVTKELEEKGKLLRDKKELIIKELEDNKYLISVREDILNIYKEMGYTVYQKVLNSAWYGAATKRDRIIIVAVRNDIDIKFEYPEPTRKNEKEYKTVGEALAEIDYSLKDIDNEPMKHANKTIERFKYVGEGQNLAQMIDKLPPELRISKFYSRGSTMRLDSKKCAPTLVPGHSNFPIHPFENRCITVREAATITGFPLTYKFFGSHTKRCEQVGNAVPPPLSNAIARQCKELLTIYYKRSEK